MGAFSTNRRAGLAWRLNRLAAMNRREIFWRIKSASRNRVEQWLLRSRQSDNWLMRKFALANNKNRAIITNGQALGHTANAWVRRWPTQIETADYQERAEAVQRGEFLLFEQNYPLGKSPNWNCDPSSNIELATTFGPNMKLRDPKKIGSLKHLWELNRHSFLLDLSQTWVLVKDPSVLSSIESYLESWLEQCPTNCGANWHSALEVAIRLINWSIAWHHLELNEADARAKQHLSKEFLHRWEQSAFEHAVFIEKHLSYGSSANNHLIGELSGLFIASQTWNKWPKAKSWTYTSKQKLSEQYVLQVHPDGVGAEQAFWYQYEISDLLMFCILLGEANLNYFPRACLERLSESIEFIRLIHINGGVPLVGDADDAHPIGLGNPAALDPFATLLATYDRYKDQPNFFTNDKVAWLVGDRKFKLRKIEGHTKTQSNYVVWRSEGGYLVAHREVLGKQVKLLADAAPLGYLSIAAHGHADALSVILSFGDLPLLIDPGTFSYKPNDPWRDWFRGTRAHNTVTIDQQDQSMIRGPFLWSNHAMTRLDNFENDLDLIWTAHHKGYERFTDRVLHRRTLMWQNLSAVITVHDDFICEHEHHYEWTWQLHPAWSYKLHEEQLLVVNGNLNACISFPSGVTASVFCGEDRCDGGWYAPRLGLKMAAPRLSCIKQFRGSWRATTTITLGVGK